MDQKTIERSIANFCINLNIESKLILQNIFHISEINHRLTRVFHRNVELEEEIEMLKFQSGIIKARIGVDDSPKKRVSSLGAFPSTEGNTLLVEFKSSDNLMRVPRVKKQRSRSQSIRKKDHNETYNFLTSPVIFNKFISRLPYNFYRQLDSVTLRYFHFTEEILTNIITRKINKELMSVSTLRNSKMGVLKPRKANRLISKFVDTVINRRSSKNLTNRNRRGSALSNKSNKSSRSKFSTGTKISKKSILSKFLPKKKTIPVINIERTSLADMMIPNNNEVDNDIQIIRIEEEKEF